MWPDRSFTWILIIIVSTDLVTGGCHEKFQVIPGHSACLGKSPKVSESGVLPSEQRKIIDLHNTYRLNVKDAMYMQKVSWDDEVAMVATKWAEHCPTTNHDQGSARFIPGRFSVGQNIAKGTASSKRNWTSIVELWYNEKSSFTYGSSNVLGAVGHYTQLVWADTYLVGCGFAVCDSKPFYVCDYGPSGNNPSIDRPYNKSDTSQLATLTDCGGISCHGDRRLTPDCKCQCDRQLHPAFTGGNTCQLDCSVPDVHSTCGGSYKHKDCSQPYVTFYCPHMCKTCPYADPSYASHSGAGIATFQSSVAIIFLILFILNVF